VEILAKDNVNNKEMDLKQVFNESITEVQDMVRKSETMKLDDKK
jgi:hypothetical protein